MRQKKITHSTDCGRHNGKPFSLTYFVKSLLGVYWNKSTYNFWKKNVSECFFLFWVIMNQFTKKRSWDNIETLFFKYNNTHVILNFAVDDVKLVKTTFRHHTERAVAVKPEILHRARQLCDIFCREHDKTVRRLVHRSTVEKRGCFLVSVPVFAHYSFVLERGSHFCDCLQHRWFGPSVYASKSTSLLVEAHIFASFRVSANWFKKKRKLFQWFQTQHLSINF